MAWNTGTLSSTAAGSLITVLDTYLTVNAHWTCYDAAAGTNCKVYKCDCSPTLFYMKVDDNYTAYALIELWQGWDADAHAGTGQRLYYGYAAANVLYIPRPVGGYVLSVGDTHLKFINSKYSPTYIGGINANDLSKNIVVWVGMQYYNSYTTYHNGLAFVYATSSSGNYPVMKTLFDEANNMSLCGYIGAYVDTLTNHYIKNKYIVGIDGKYRSEESRIFNNVTKTDIGQLIGVINIGDQSNGLVNWATVSIDGVDWAAINGDALGYWALVKKA